MNSEVSLAQVEALAAQLPAAERLRLAARLCSELSVTLTNPASGEELSEQERQAALVLAEHLLDQCADRDDESQGIDTAELVRQGRDERISRICGSDA